MIQEILVLLVRPALQDWTDLLARLDLLELEERKALRASLELPAKLELKAFRGCGARRVTWDHLVNLEQRESPA